MKLWNCVNILNINLASAIFPLNKLEQIYEVSHIKKLEGTSRESQCNELKLVLPGLVKVYVGVTNNNWLNRITRNECTNLEGKKNSSIACCSLRK